MQFDGRELRWLESEREIDGSLRLDSRSFCRRWLERIYSSLRPYLGIFSYFYYFFFFVRGAKRGEHRPFPEDLPVARKQQKARRFFLLFFF